MTNPAKKERNEQVLKMRKGGMTYQEIANLLDISRQRVHQIIKNNKYDIKISKPHKETA